MNSSRNSNIHSSGDPAPVRRQPPDLSEEFSFRVSGGNPDGQQPTSPVMSPFNSTSSFQSPPASWDIPTSPWTSSVITNKDSLSFRTGLMGSLVRQEGHIYSLAAAGDLLYTGTESRNIRVWKNQKEFSAFKSRSGLVKAIVISGDRIFSGHQDGKIRVWKMSTKDPRSYKQVGTMPTFKSLIKGSFNPSNYIESRRNNHALWIQHTDAVSSLSLSEDKSLLYSCSWDRTFRVWRISDSKCVESVSAHDDAVNSIVSGFNGLVFTGSADGTVKVWRREFVGKNTKHVLWQTLLKQECAITALAIDSSDSFFYSGSSDGMINFWMKGKFLSHGGVLRSHKLAVLCLAAAGNLLFSGSADTNICVWRREGGIHFCSAVLIGHGGPVKCLAVEEENGSIDGGGGRYVVHSGSIDKSVKIWRVVAPSPRDQQRQSTSPPVQNPGASPGLPALPSFSFPTQKQ